MSLQGSNKAVDNLTLLVKRGQELSSIGDLDALIDMIMATASEITGAVVASVLLLDRKNNELYFRAATGNADGQIQKIRLQADQGIAGWVIQNQEPAIINDVASDPRHFSKADKETNFKTKNILCVPILWENRIIGVIEAINKNEDFTEQDLEFLTILANQAGSSVFITMMVDKLQNFHINMLEIMMLAAETIGSNQGHSIRVARLATKIARQMRVTDDDYKDIYYASLIHDIGQIKIAKDKIIGGERLVPALGAEMIRPIKMLKRIPEIIEAHHEKWDGSGYPKALTGEQIPLGARIIALAEEYEEWKEEESYRKQFDPFYQDDFFKRIIKAHDPSVVEAFKEVRKREREKTPLGSPKKKQGVVFMEDKHLSAQ